MHTWIPPERFFAYLTWTEIQAMPDRANVVIVQPVGAIEQHGPHLPLVVDSAISLGVLGAALQRLPVEIPAYALPPLCYGKSNEHLHFPGTICLSAQTLMAVLLDVGNSLYRAGFRKWVLLNAHGGQPQVLQIVARDLHQQYPDFYIFPLFVWQVPNCTAEMLTPQEQAMGIHAGDAETSLMLSLLPEQVRWQNVVAEYPPPLPPQSLLSLEGALPFSWGTQDISQTGVIGDPLPATRQKGDRILASLATGWVQVLQEVYHFRGPSKISRSP